MPFSLSKFCFPSYTHSLLLVPWQVLRERRVPDSPMGRAMGFAAMGASLMLGTLGDRISRAWTGPSGSEAEGGKGEAYSNFITQANAERLANSLCRCEQGVRLHMEGMVVAGGVQPLAHTS
jgi:hypothetical protein